MIYSRIFQNNLVCATNLSRTFQLRCLSTSWKRNSQSDSHQHTFRAQNFIKTGVALGVGGIGLSLWMYSQKHEAASSSVLTNFSEEIEKYGNRIDGLPEYNLDQVAEHCNLKDRVWVSFRSGIYDITSFIQEHPGGDKIMLGAGGAVEPFWALYAVHKSPHVLEILEKYRIGNLAPEDVGICVKDMSDPYANEPKRHKALKPSSKQPFNAEPPYSLLADSVITPSEIFYVRNHLPVPVVDPKTYELEVEGLTAKNLTLSLDQLKKLPKHKMIAAIQCGGNRRSEMTKVKPVKGLSWGQAAISNAEWGGVLLSDVLKAAGVDQSSKAKHVQFEGLDFDPTSHPYGASIPFTKAIDPRGDVLLAYEMNGEPLSRDHGFPVRVVVPGTVGARNVKWLGRIIVSEVESDSHWQQNDYKGFAPNVDWDTVDFSKSPAIQEMPVTSAICQPEKGDVVVPTKDGKVLIKGYAYSGGGRKIVRVDVSQDDGKTWQAATSLEPSTPDPEPGRDWGWTLWSAELPVAKGQKEMNLCSKAVDASYNVQPESFENIWNLRGVLSNAYHRVKVTVLR